MAGEGFFLTEEELAELDAAAAVLVWRVRASVVCPQNAQRALGRGRHHTKSTANPDLSGITRTAVE
jgi:hypothetical protein